MNSALLAIIALVGAEIHTGTGEVITNGTLVMKDGTIESIGPQVAVPDDAIVVDAKGTVITPGFMDAYTRLGLVEVGAVAGSNDTDSGFKSPIRAAQRAVDSLNLHGSLIPIQRAHGVTTVLSAPSGGLISGQAALVNLEANGVIRSSAAMVIGLGGQNDGSRGARILRLREAFRDARAYARNRTAFLANKMRRLSAGPLDLEALGPVVRGEMPVLVSVNRRSDIVTVVRLAEEEGLQIILVGAQEAWQVAPLLARKKVPIILNPTAVLPGSFDAVHVRPDAPRRLLDAGVSIAISTMSTHNVRKLRQWAGNAVREGLKPSEALVAITSAPARMLGLKKRGTLAPGMVADVVIWTGDPFEFSTEVQAVYISGKAQDMDHRQLKLFRKYRVITP